MAKTQTIRARVEPPLKREVEAIFKKIGINPSEAITMFLAQVKLHQGMPFPVRVAGKGKAKGKAKGKRR